MIEIMLKCSTSKEMEELGDRLHYALVGSPSYINSEISLFMNKNNEMPFKMGLSKEEQNGSIIHLFIGEDAKGENKDILIRTNINDISVDDIKN